MNNSNEKIIGSLPLTGTNLYYEVRGSGPVLLMIPAGGGDAGGYADVAEYLSAWYTVVTYDRRGYSHSKLTDPDEIPSIQTSADDIHEVLAKVTNEPAFVFGSSSGGVIALDLLTRYADQLKAIVIHEPAKFIIPNPDEPFVDLGKLFKEGGPAAVQKFIGVDFASRKSAVGGDGVQREANMKFFMQKEPKMVGSYEYNLDGLKVSAKKIKIIIGGSSTAKQAIGYRGAKVAATFFNLPVTSFPGDHAGYIAYPQEFATALHAVFQI